MISISLKNLELDLNLRGRGEGLEEGGKERKGNVRVGEIKDNNLYFT